MIYELGIRFLYLLFVPLYCIITLHIDIDSFFLSICCIKGYNTHTCTHTPMKQQKRGARAREIEIEKEEEKIKIRQDRVETCCVASALFFLRNQESRHFCDRFCKLSSVLLKELLSFQSNSFVHR